MSQEDNGIQSNQVEEEPQSDSAATDTLLGLTVDRRYHIAERIGKGGTAAVYRCLHIGLQQPMAMKGLYYPSTEAKDRFEREIRHLARIESPQVVRISDCGTLSDGRLYYVMELVGGCTLSAWQDNRPVPEETVVRIGIQTCKGLKAAHDVGIIHRDLKPDNVMLWGSDYDVKLLDFGIAKAQEETSVKAGFTLLGRVIGTPYYMSPEQCSGKKVDHRSDIYSFGVVLYELLAGRPPYREKPDQSDDDDLHDILRQHEEDPPPPLSQFVSVSDGMQNLVMKCLAKNPDDRFQTVDELLTALRKLPHAMTLEPVSAAPPPSPAIPPSPVELMRHKWLGKVHWPSVGKGVVTGAIIMFLCVGVYFFASSAPRPEPEPAANVTAAPPAVPPAPTPKMNPAPAPKTPETSSPAVPSTETAEPETVKPNPVTPESVRPKPATPKPRPSASTPPAASVTRPPTEPRRDGIVDPWR
jgi:serine/threonine-protein kinase